MPSASNPAPAAETRLHPIDAGPVRLRAHREDDLADFFALYSDPRVMRYWSFPAWTDIAQAQDRFASALSGQGSGPRCCWAIAERESDRLIGGITVFAIDREHARAEIGYALGSAFWGQGLARRAMQAALGHAFDHLGLRRIEADIDPRNTGSRQLVERLGFVQEGLLRERWDVAGELQDSVIYGLLARDWKKMGSE